MKIKPLNDWAVLVPSDAEERTAGGIFLPDSAREKPAEGTVEAIGPGALEEEGFGKKKKEKKDRKFIPTTVKPGDRVLYERFAGQKITLENAERVLVRERDILGLVTGAPAGSGSSPLMLPEKTGSSGSSSLATLAMTAITAHAPAQPLKKPGQGRTVKAKKTAKAKKAAGKTAKKSASKKTTAPRKKAAKNPAKKKR